MSEQQVNPQDFRPASAGAPTSEGSFGTVRPTGPMGAVLTMRQLESMGVRPPEVSSWRSLLSAETGVSTLSWPGIRARP